MSKFKLSILGLLGTLLPSIASAEVWGNSVSSDSFAYASMFAGNFSLLLSIVIGIIATYLVFRAAKKMGGGLFGSVLNYIGVGMVFMILGTMSFVLDTWTQDLWLSIINTVCFAFGYIFIVVGANKLLKGIINT